MDLWNAINAGTIELKELDLNKTVLIVVDMVNGFIYEGPLASLRVEPTIAPIVSLHEATKGMQKIFFIDEHDEDATEFGSYPPHCVVGTTEAQIVDALMCDATQSENVWFAKKNSTNGFFAPVFQQWLKDHESAIDNYIITGCVTDICVLQFALTLKSYFNQINLKKRLIVPVNTVQTYDYEAHHGDTMHEFALYNMFINGVEIVSEVIV